MAAVDRRWWALGLVIVVAPALGADPPAATPAPTPPAVATPAAAPPAAAPVPPAADVLAACTKLLRDQRYAEALEIALPAISTYPDQAKSFEAVASIATDQLSRAATPPPVAIPPAYQAGDGPVVVYRSSPPRSGARKAASKSALRWGFDLGFPTGLRAEWHLEKSVVTDVGVRAGGNVLFYDGVHVSSDVTFFVDWRLAKTWDLETSVGTVVYYGYPYATIGAAAQYDPKGPIQMQFGARVGPYTMVVPEASVSFVW